MYMYKYIDIDITRQHKQKKIVRRFRCREYNGMPLS